MTGEKEEEEQEEGETGFYCGEGFRVKVIRVGTMHAGQKEVSGMSGGAGAGSFRFYCIQEGYSELQRGTYRATRFRV